MTTKTTSTNGKVLRGTVVKSAMQDTVTVSVNRYVKHEKYQKYYSISKKYLVHNPGNTVSIGDIVEIRETRPISKRKRFVIDSVVSQVQKGDE
jgi:small subunit ribosomal protein S17